MHVGGEVNFGIDSADGVSTGSNQLARYDAPDSSTRWSSNDPNILEIDSKTGKARANQEGKVDISLNHHSNAASIVHVNKVQYGSVDPQSSLVINTATGYANSRTIKVRVKFFL